MTSSWGQIPPRPGLSFRLILESMTNTTTELNVTAWMPIVTPRGAYDIIPNWYPGWDIPLLSFYVIVVFCGAGNWLIALTIILHKKLRKPFNALVAVLACVYGLFTLVVAPMEVVELSHKFAGESWLWCKMKIILRTGVFYITMLLLLTVAIIRLALGLTSKKIDLRTKHVFIIGVLIVPTAVALTIMSSPEDGTLMLTCTNNVAGLTLALQQYADVKLVLFSTTTIFICTVISYIALIITLKIRERLIMRNPNQPKRKFHIVTSRVALWVITGFCLSFLGPFVSKIVHIWWQPSLQERPHTMAAYNAAIFIQATLHPFIYFRENPTIRATAIRILRRLSCYSRVGPGDSDPPPAPPQEWFNTFTDVTKPWWRHRMEIFSALLVICAGNSPVSVSDAELWCFLWPAPEWTVE